MNRLSNTLYLVTLLVLLAAVLLLLPRNIFAESTTIFGVPAGNGTPVCLTNEYGDYVEVNLVGRIDRTAYVSGYADLLGSAGPIRHATVGMYQLKEKSFSLAYTRITDEGGEFVLNDMGRWNASSTTGFSNWINIRNDYGIVQAWQTTTCTNPAARNSINTPSASARRID